jgi:DeoR family transcriptional regulator, fructose operon transcriptional repressor
LKPIERQQEIVSLLRAMQTELRVEDLARVLGVSALTIRRDLDLLAEEALLIRTHGGCIAAGRAALETEYHKKVAQNFPLKQAVGRAAAAEVKAGDVVLINDGSTTFHLAAHLEDKGPLTVYTNSLAMITDLSRCRELTLYILGGRYNSELYSLQGGMAVQVLESLSLDLCFIGADAVTAEGQCMVTTPEEASLTREMLRRGGRRILMADHTKYAARGHFAFGSLRDFDLWITTPGIDPAALEVLGKLTTIKEAE